MTLRQDAAVRVDRVLVAGVEDERVELLDAEILKELILQLCRTEGLLELDELNVGPLINKSVELLASVKVSEIVIDVRVTEPEL